MKIFTITARVTTERTITLAADSIAEALQAAQERAELMAEADIIEEETLIAEAR